MIGSAKGSLITLIKDDLSAYSKGSTIKALSTVLLDPGFKATWNYRWGNMLYRRFGFEILPRWLCYRSRKKFAIDIDFRAKIDGGFRIIHGIGVVIGFDVQIGKNVTLYQGVTLGGNSGKTAVREGKEHTQPWLGENVCVFANSTVLGPVYIGENSTVGAGSMLMKDIPEDSVVFCKRIVEVCKK